MITRRLVCWGVIALTFASPSLAAFVGELKLVPVGCEAEGFCTVEKEFGYVDLWGLGWMARAGLLTDGASIPPWDRPFVGQPFEAAFIKAAIIHDHYCDRHVHPWRQTHRVFFDALLESGVREAKQASCTLRYSSAGQNG
ncbi:DUF1353 domain-containing protein [Neorhizobium vignae]|uniref:DUF1353 domain-containing protein n=1 Tax=Neorhizobium vignae TaxID=690585 RepID=UPI00068D9BEA|nr:DUF1353 domain-containing protein [Neorhizobium vignae]